MNDLAAVQLCIGAGNEFRHDDAAGLHVARRLLAARLPDLRIVQASGEGAALMRLWSGFQGVIVVDAARSGAPAGSIHRFEAHKKALPTRFFSYSTHAFSIAEAIEMARVLRKLPPYLLVFGIEGADFSMGPGLSPAVEHAVDQVVYEILHG